MIICKKGHEPISYEGGRCPLCQTMGRNEILKRQVENLTLEVLFDEVDLLLDFEMKDCRVGHT